MFFVMLNHPSQDIPAIPMVNENDDISFFEDVESAKAAAKDNDLGENFGFDIFQLGNGE